MPAMTRVLRGTAPGQMLLERSDEARGEAQAAPASPFQKASRGSDRERLRLVQQETDERLAPIVLRPLRELGCEPPEADVPGVAGPSLALSQRAHPTQLKITGTAKRSPSHRATGTLTALPTSFHLKLERVTDSAGLVQSTANPCSRSASRMSGVTMRPSGIQMAGGDGTPTVEPPFKVGTASTAQPRPRTPSVQ